jgi:cell division protein FtsN
MNIIEKYIKELLIENDQVIIPELGSFIKKSIPSEISHTQKKISPPSKKVVFTPQDDDPQKLLIAYLQEKENMNADEAMKHIREYVENIMHQVKSGSSAEIDEIGTLQLEEGKLKFDSAAREDAFNDAFGLGLIEIEIPEEESTPENKQEVKKEPPLLGSQYYVDDKQNNTVLWTVIIIFILLAPAVFFITSKTTVIQDVFGKPATETTSDNVLSDAQADSSLSATYDSIDKSTAQQLAALNQKESALLPTGISDQNDYYAKFSKFYLIAGSFDTRKYAEIQMRDLISKGYFEAEIVHSDGRFRVALFSYSKRSDALAKLESLRRDYSSKVWVLSME